MENPFKTPITADDLIVEICLQLEANPRRPPHFLDPRTAAEVIGVKPSTLALWRSTGRYNLPYVKAGRLVQYRLTDVVKFLMRRTALHTGEGPDNA